ncbi:MAG: hypothetical protein MZV70_13190 [Desulfobacterales bacterium]|nr:hypothetical protein [Desulfobacterales bacterium]
MARKVTDILLVSSPYEAFIMEEEGRLAERIIHEYRGLNLSRPPMLTWVSHRAGGARRPAAQEVRPRDHHAAGGRHRRLRAGPHDQGRTSRSCRCSCWCTRPASTCSTTKPPTARRSTASTSGRATRDLLLALIKNLEDRMNVAFDTERARVRVIVLVEDSPVHYSSLLPILYKEIVTQTQAAMEESVNDEHRIFRMRARPKILVARTYEEAVEL